MLVWIVGGALAWLLAAIGCGMLIGRMFSRGAATPSNLAVALTDTPAQLPLTHNRRRTPTVSLPPAWERRALAEPKTTSTQRRRRLSA